ncbi:hypothetical protein [Streptomyces collinus]
MFFAGARALRQTTQAPIGFAGKAKITSTLMSNLGHPSVECV